MKKLTKMNGYLLVAVIACVAGALGWFVYQDSNKSVSEVSRVNSSAVLDTNENIAPVIPKTVKVSGEYSFSDMTGLSYFYTPRKTEGGQEVQYSFGESEGAVDPTAHEQIVGALSPFSDSCYLRVEATIEIANPVLVKEDFKHQVNEYQASFVRVVSKGKIFDDCATGANGAITRTERKIPRAIPTS